MRSSVTAALLIVCLVFSQLPGSASAQAAQPATVTVAAGTVVPLTLVSQIKSKSSKPGDSIRAVVAFPVTVGTQSAIPAGTYVEGTLLTPAPKVKHQPDPGVRIHFTRLVFANGYSALLDATQTSALAIPPVPSSPGAPPQWGAMALSASFGSFDPASFLSAMGFRMPSLASGWRSWLMSPQTTTPTAPPSLPHVGPSTGAIVGIALASVVPLVLVVLFHHRTGNSDFIVHDAGWQFQMKLDAPLTLNTAQIVP
ncbi:hypothetical protein [Granulicella aggregans]|jgi:hypothetical protein|uniref:hypothetical protein n=1 Tax=Granulicella aggregans TaxID=474949 RepID=UPI0021DFF402|nr:hypothetical protein [Granulicella aggregans]